MKHLLVALAALASLSGVRASERFTGVVTDSECATADHSAMRMGPTDAECATACAGFHGASYMLYDGRTSYTLSDQKTSEPFAGQRVIVVGTLDAKTSTIQVESITAAK